MRRRLKTIAIIMAIMTVYINAAAQEHKWPLPMSLYGELSLYSFSNYDTKTGARLLQNKDQTAALGYLQRAAKQGDGYAMAILGDLYAHGRGVVKKDMNIAKNMFTKATATGNSLVHCYIGKLYCSENRTAEGMAEFRKAAEMDDVYGYYLLSAYSWLAKDYPKAMEYMEQMARLGMKIKGMIGLIYANGTIVEKDYAKAFRYLSDNDSYYRDEELMELARLYYYGRGTGEDVKHQPNSKYKVWFYKKGEDGQASITDALILLDRLVEKGYEPAESMRAQVKNEYEERNREHNKTTSPQFGQTVTQYIRNYKEPSKPAIASAGRGEIVITARISAAGYVSGAQIKYRVLQRLDEAALTLVRNMPKWIPGTRGGFSADMNVEIGVSFFPLRVRMIKYSPAR